MSKKVQGALLSLILLLAAALRLTGLDWDDYNHYHPDERYISWVATSIEWPQDWSSALKPHESTFNPFYWPNNAESKGIVLEQGEPRRFAYGHLPLYLGVAVTRILERIGPRATAMLPDRWLLTEDILNGANRIEYRHLTAAGRALTAVLDVATVGLLFILGRALYGPAVGLLAAAFLAITVLHIQLAHFFAVDPFLTFFGLAALTLLVLAVREEDKPKRKRAMIASAALFIGLAVGSKFSGILLIVPLAVTVWLNPKHRNGQRLVWFAFTLALAFAVFVLTNPFAVLDLSCRVITPAVRIGPLEIPELNWGSCYLQDVGSQGAMVRGARDVPYVRQYIGTTPFLYYVEMQLRWGMGPLLGLVAFAGFFWAIAKLFVQQGSPALAGWRVAAVYRKREVGRWLAGLDRAELIGLSWVLPFFLTTGALEVKFMRYIQPIAPWLMLYGAAMLLNWHKVAWRRLVIGLVLLTAGLYALSFVQLYRQPHPWIAASRWIYQNAEPVQKIVSEAWDDSLPDDVEAGGVARRRSLYQSEDVNWLSGTEESDSQDKLEENLAILATADYIVLASNRNYGVIPRLPKRYPLSSQYYSLLFDGRLGFELVYAHTRTPQLFGFHIVPDPFGWPGLKPPTEVSDYLNSLRGLHWGRFDESFTVYDQPLVMIFGNSSRLTASEMQASFDLSRVSTDEG